MITATPQSVTEGSGTYVARHTLSEGLRTLGHEVGLVCPDRAPGPLGYTVHRFRFNRTLRAASVDDADLVVGWDMDGYRLAGRTAGRFVAYIHGQLADEARYERGLVALSMRLQALAERHSVRHAAVALAVSEYGRQRLTAVYGVPADRVRVVPPAFDVDRWHRALGAVRAVDEGERPTVLCVARLYPRKDVATLIRAADRLRRQVTGLRVCVAGDGPEGGRLRALVRRLGLAGCVELWGQVDWDRLVSAYATCRVFCLPSRQEGFGIVFLEAMAAGKPIVACRGTAAEELVSHERDGLLVPQGDPDAVADALHRLLTDPALRHRCGAGGPERVGAFAPAAIARRLLAAATDS